MKRFFLKILCSHLFCARTLIRLLVVLVVFGAHVSVFADPTISSKTNRLCFVSDINGPYGSLKPPSGVDVAVAHLRRLQCGLVIGAGDLIAGQDSSLSDSHLRLMWDGFRQFVLNPVDEVDVPVLSALGNHDASAARSIRGDYLFERERRVALEFWNKRRQEANFSRIDWLSDQNYPFFYSVRFGTTGIIFIDGSSATEIRSRRLWLEDQLMTLAADSSVNTRIVVGHLPLVGIAVGRDRPGEILADSRSLYELFDSNKVDFYVSGHHHSFYPGRVEQWSRNHGTVQLALGALGDGPRNLVGNTQIPAQNALTFIDIDDSRLGSDSRFSMATLLPKTGEYLFSQSLPAMLQSVDGTGQIVPLKRVDYREVFPFPFP